MVLLLFNPRRWRGSGTPRLRWLWPVALAPGRDLVVQGAGHGRARCLIVGGRRCAVRGMTQLLSPTGKKR